MSPTPRAARLAAVSLLAASCLVWGASAARAEQAKPSQPRRLDTITIEGEIPLPQVLFITSRGAARFDDGLVFWFLPDAAGLAQALGGPLRPAASPCDLRAPEMVPAVGTANPAAAPTTAPRPVAPKEGVR